MRSVGPFISQQIWVGSQHELPQQNVLPLQMPPPVKHGGISHLPVPQKLVSPLHLIPQPPQLVGSFLGLTQTRLQQSSVD
jgi:hypothetical protein